jgi:predicted ATPase
VRRYVITGAPGAGKTTILAALHERGHAVVPEAATDVIAQRQAAGTAEPWQDEDFLDAVAQLQRERQAEPVADDVQLFDRSPICTLALARYSARPVTPVLAREVARAVAESIYQPQVFFVHLLGFITPTAARRISYAQSVTFGRYHEEAYREHGFELVDVPVAPVGRRADLIDRYVRREFRP